MDKNKNNQTIWNIRIKKNISTVFQKVGSSIDIDKKLYKEDITNFKDITDNTYGFGKMLRSPSSFTKARKIKDILESWQ